MEQIMVKAHRHPPLMVLVGLLLSGLGPLGAQAPASPPEVRGSGAAILVAPTRLIFDDRKRSDAVSLTNTGTGPGKYRISLVRMEMAEDGGTREQPLEASPGQPSVPDMVHFSPREVTLKPQEGQVVRIQIRKPADLPAGEYRVHMVFREEPPEAPEPPPGKEDEQPQGITIRLTSLFGVAIPVIIRHGETSAKVAITGLALDPANHRLNFRVERTGNQSVYGDFKATFQPRGGKASRVVAQVNGVAVYTPNAFRSMFLPLDAGANLGPGQLKVTYTNTAEQGGSLLAEGVLEVP